MIDNRGQSLEMTCVCGYFFVIGVHKKNLAFYEKTCYSKKDCEHYFTWRKQK